MLWLLNKSRRKHSVQPVSRWQRLAHLLAGRRDAKEMEEQLLLPHSWRRLPLPSPAASLKPLGFLDIGS